MSDALFTAFADLRSAVFADISVRSEGLARLIEITPARPVPSLVLAYRVYGDIDRADEITTRNRVRHPGFIPAAPLKVLGNV